MQDGRHAAGGVLTSATPCSPSADGRLDRLAGWVGILAAIATLANGSGFFLRRIGVIDTEAYRRDLLTFCTQPIREFWLPASCRFRMVLSLRPLKVLTLDSSRLYEVTGPELLLKLAKYGVLGGLILFSLVLILRRTVPPPRWRSLLPAAPLALTILLSLAITTHRAGLPVAIASLLSVAWAPLIVVGGWLTTPTRLHRLANAVAGLMLVQLPLALVEATRGLPTSSTSRLAQAFILPNSLGVFTVCGLAFCISFSRNRRWLPWLHLGALATILLARSAAGTIALLALLALPGLERLLRRHRRKRHALAWAATTAAIAALLAPGLPKLLGRADLLASLTGRLHLLMHELDPRHPLALLFGQGLGAAGSRISELFSRSDLFRPLLGGLWPDPPPTVGPSDSMVLLLLVQGGLLAVLAFYGLLIRAMFKTPCARPFLLSVLLCSLTLNITDLFPIDLLLAVALCRSLQPAADLPIDDRRPQPLPPRGAGPLSRWFSPRPTPPSTPQDPLPIRHGQARSPGG